MLDSQRKSGNVIAIQIKSFCGSQNKRERGKTEQKKSSPSSFFSVTFDMLKSARKLGARMSKPNENLETIESNSCILQTRN